MRRCSVTDAVERSRPDSDGEAVPNVAIEESLARTDYGAVLRARSDAGGAERSQRDRRVPARQRCLA